MGWRVRSVGGVVHPGQFWNKPTAELHCFVLIAGGIWIGDNLIAVIEEVEKIINAKDVLISQKGEEFIFPVADGTAKLSGRDRELPEPTLWRERTVRSEDLSGELQGEPEGPQPTETKHDAAAREDFWSIQGDFICRHHFEPRVQLHVPQEESLPAPLRYVDVIRSTHTDLDVAEEKRIADHWKVDVTKNIQKDICGPGEADKNSSNHQTCEFVA